MAALEDSGECDDIDWQPQNFRGSMISNHVRSQNSSPGRGQAGMQGIGTEVFVQCEEDWEIRR